jgi:hypothetical protein
MPYFLMPMPCFSMQIPDIFIPMPYLVMSMPFLSMPMPLFSIQMPFFSIQIPNMSVQMPYIFMQMPNILHQTLNIVMQMPYILIQVLNIVRQASNILIQTANMAAQTSNMLLQMPNILIKSPERPAIAQMQSCRLYIQSISCWVLEALSNACRACFLRLINSGVNSLLKVLFMASIISLAVFFTILACLQVGACKHIFITNAEPAAIQYVKQF